MSNKTMFAEQAYALLTYIKPNYPATNVDNYYDATTLAEKFPSGAPDRLLQHIVELVLAVRTPEIYGYNAPMSNAEVKDFYGDLDRHLQDAAAAIAVVQAAIHTHYLSLP